MIRTALRSWPACLVGAFLVGLTFHLVKGVSDPRDLWVGNLSWPYVLVPALACIGGSSTLGTILRASTSGVAMVLGFYNVGTIFTATAASAGLAPGTPRLVVMGNALRSYVELNVLGTGGIPWVPVSAGAGLLIACLYRLTASRARVTLFWILLAVLGFMEPLLHFAPFLSWAPFGGYRFDTHATEISAAEIGLAALLLALAFANRRASAVSPRSG